MSRKLFILVGLGVFLLSGKPAFCWDHVGHMIVDQIAFEHLTPAAKHRALMLLAVLNTDSLVTGLAPEYQPYNFVTAGAWMDDIKGETREFNSWHYVDLPDHTSARTIATDFADDSHPNVYEVIVKKCETTLADPRASKADKARMLAFLMHLTGDIHQPLHCAERDRGGNAYKIAPLPSFDSTWTVDNIHAFWDNAYRYDTVHGQITVVVGLEPFPRTMKPNVGPIKSLADAMQRTYPKAERGMQNDNSPADWAVESNKLASTIVFPTPASQPTPRARNPVTLTPEYVHQAHDIACHRLLLAGLRLAATLNRILH